MKLFAFFSNLIAGLLYIVIGYFCVVGFGNTTILSSGKDFLAYAFLFVVIGMFASDFLRSAYYAAISLIKEHRHEKNSSDDEGQSG